MFLSPSHFAVTQFPPILLFPSPPNLVFSQYPYLNFSQSPYLIFSFSPILFFSQSPYLVFPSPPILFSPCPPICFFSQSPYLVVQESVFRRCSQLASCLVDQTVAVKKSLVEIFTSMQQITTFYQLLQALTGQICIIFILAQVKKFKRCCKAKCGVKSVCYHRPKKSKFMEISKFLKMFAIRSYFHILSSSFLQTSLF